MTEAQYNPNDPAYLASRALDEELPAEERRRLDAALAESAELRVEAGELAGVDRLVKRWAGDGPELDWENHARLVSDRINSDVDEGDLAQVDRLLTRWGQDSAEIDADRFTAEVMQRVCAADQRHPRRNLLLRLAVPLAAAAAIVVAVTGPFRQTTAPSTVSQVAFRPIVQAAALPQTTSIVQFDRTAVADATPGSEDSSLSILIVGSSPLPRAFEEVPPA